MPVLCVVNEPERLNIAARGLGAFAALIIEREHATLGESALQRNQRFTRKARRRV